MTEERQAIIQNYIKSYNSFDVIGMTKDLAEDVIFENVRDGKVDLRTEGLSEFKKQAEGVKQFFEEREQKIDSWEFNGDTILIKIDYKALLAVDFTAELKKGDTIKLKGTSEFYFENEKIKKITDEG